MGRHKGGKNHRWTDEERLKYVLLYEEGKMTLDEIATKYNISKGTLRGLVRRYRLGGEEALNPQKLHPGNAYAALHNSKSLSKEQRLELTVKKLRIENERLKKGYTVKGVGANKEFVIIKDLNTK